MHIKGASQAQQTYRLGIVDIVHPRQKQKMSPSGEDSGYLPSIF